MSPKSLSRVQRIFLYSTTPQSQAVSASQLSLLPFLPSNASSPLTPFNHLQFQFNQSNFLTKSRDAILIKKGQKATQQGGQFTIRPEPARIHQPKSSIITIITTQKPPSKTQDCGTKRTSKQSLNQTSSHTHKSATNRHQQSESTTLKTNHQNQRNYTNTVTP
jgi:hypothetical protein